MSESSDRAKRSASPTDGPDDAEWRSMREMVNNLGRQRIQVTTAPTSPAEPIRFPTVEDELALLPGVETLPSRRRMRRRASLGVAVVIGLGALVLASALILLMRARRAPDTGRGSEAPATTSIVDEKAPELEVHAMPEIQRHDAPTGASSVPIPTRSSRSAAPEPTQTPTKQMIIRPKLAGPAAAKPPEPNREPTTPSAIPDEAAF